MDCTYDQDDTLQCYIFTQGRDKTLVFPCGCVEENGNRTELCLDRVMLDGGES